MSDDLDTRSATRADAGVTVAGASARDRFADVGLRHAELWVNGRNESATRLYRRAGMTAVESARRFVELL